MNNYHLYQVGGYVRDKLLDIQSNDIDFCFVINQDNTNNYNITIEEGFQIMKIYLLNQGFKIFLETPNMLTIRAKFPTYYSSKDFIGLTADFVLARKEISYPNDSRQPVVTIGTLKDDILRRDFTVNALAIDLEGNIIDFCGGKEDLNNKILRTPIDPRITMIDDPLRVLRALRFSITRDFIISKDLWNAMIQPEVMDKLFTVVSSERIREELTKMFKHSTIKTLHMFKELDKHVPDFLIRLFANNNLWLKPTTENKK